MNGYFTAKNSFIPEVTFKKESEEVCILIWTNFDSFAFTYLA